MFESVCSIYLQRNLSDTSYKAIFMYDTLLLMLSDASMNSLWVKTEIANTRAREDPQKGQMLLPITFVPFGRFKEWSLFDADRGIDSARQIRGYCIPDFSRWKITIRTRIPSAGCWETSRPGPRGAATA